MKRDQQEVPMIVQKCAEAVEKYGLHSVGIYRESGTGTQIQKLKADFNRSKWRLRSRKGGWSLTAFKYDVDCQQVNLDAEDYRADVNNITGVLKLWFRELPSPLFPQAAYDHFITAASKSAIRHIHSNWPVTSTHNRNRWWTNAYSRITYCHQWSSWRSLCHSEVSHGPFKQVRRIRHRRKCT